MKASFGVGAVLHWREFEFGTTPQQPSGTTALDILKKRFARGEIDKAEYEERKRLLGE